MSVQTLERPPELPPPPDPAPPATAASGSGSGGRRGWRRKLVTVAAIASLGIGSGVAGGYVATGLEEHSAAAVAPTPVTTGTTGTGTTGSSLAAVAAAVAPSVVSITAQSASEQVEGSGVVLTADGLT